MAKGQIKQARAKIDKEIFENLCAIQCTELEICGILDISHDTLWRWCKDTYNEDFANIYKIKSAKGKMSLRRNMFKQAEKNPTMAIWLSKQHLGMKDNIEVEHDAKNGVIDELIGALNKAKENK